MGWRKDRWPTLESTAGTEWKANLRVLEVTPHRGASGGSRSHKILSQALLQPSPVKCFSMALQASSVSANVEKGDPAILIAPLPR